MQPISTTLSPMRALSPVVSVSSTTSRSAISRPCHLDAHVRQLVRALVARVARMPLHPAPVYAMRVRCGVPGGARDPRSSPAFCRPSSSRAASTHESTRRCPFAHTANRYTATTLQGRFSVSSALITAISSMRLLVVGDSPPKISFSFPLAVSSAPQPPGTRIALAGAVGVDLDGIFRHLFAGSHGRSTGSPATAPPTACAPFSRRASPAACRWIA